MITYRFISQTFLGQKVDVQYSKYDSFTRIDLGSGTFPFEYTTDQLAGTYYFYVQSVDATFPKVIDPPPIDIYTEFVNVPDCDISGVTVYVPPCDIIIDLIEVPVCDIEWSVGDVTQTPTPTPTPTITQTQTPSSETPTPTPSITTTSSNTPTLTQTPTITPTITPTKCVCYSFNMYGGTVPPGSDFQVVYCDNSIGVIHVNHFTMYETQYGSILCAMSVERISGDGIVYQHNNCGCIPVTPTPTSSTTPTPTPSTPQVVPQCAVIFNSEENVFFYDLNTNTTTQLIVPNTSVDHTNDIAHTTTKLWMCNYESILEWDITLSPFSAVFNRTITLPHGIDVGLGVIDNNTLVAVNYETTPSSLVTLDITNNIATSTYKFDLIAQRDLSGDILLTTTNKIIVTTYDYSDNVYITQYDYPTGENIIDIQISPIIHSPWGIFEDGYEIYVMTADEFDNVFRIDNTYPYAITLVDSTGHSVYGASQIPSCMNVDFVPNTGVNTIFIKFDSKPFS